MAPKRTVKPATATKPAAKIPRRRAASKAHSTGDVSASATPFDPAPYVQSPKLSVAGGITLVKGLLAAAGRAPPPAVKTAQAHLASVVKSAESDLVARKKKFGPVSDEDARALDNEADRVWGGCRLRLQGLTMLPKGNAAAAEAVALDDKLFGVGGTEFLKAEWSEQRTEMQTRLDLIASEGLAGQLDKLAGKDFLPAMRAVQTRYDAMVAGRLQRDEALGQNLHATRRGLAEAIVYYATKVVGLVERGDPASVTRVEKLLRPIAKFRADSLKKGAASLPDDPGPSEEATSATAPG